MNVTIADIAKATGLAKSTISGALNNKSGFSEKHAEGYWPQQKNLATFLMKLPEGYRPNRQGPLD